MFRIFTDITRSPSGHAIAGLAQFFHNAARQHLVDFIMSRDGLGDLRPGILIPVVLAAVPDEDTTHLRELLDERDPLHET